MPENMHVIDIINQKSEIIVSLLQIWLFIQRHNKYCGLSQMDYMGLRGMHLLMAFIASIGKLFGDGDLLQLLTLTDVYAEATAHQMFQGKKL